METKESQEQRKERRRVKKEEEEVVYKTNHHPQHHHQQHQEQHQERLPESSEVFIASHHNQNNNNNNNNNKEHYKHLRNPVARGLKPSYAASARKVLMDSARGLSRLQERMQDLVHDSLTSNVSSLYVNETFEDGKPCQVKGCPLNPTTRVRQG